MRQVGWTLLKIEKLSSRLVNFTDLFAQILKAEIFINSDPVLSINWKPSVEIENSFSAPGQSWKIFTVT